MGYIQKVVSIEGILETQHTLLKQHEQGSQLEVWSGLNSTHRKHTFYFTHSAAYSHHEGWVTLERQL